MISFIKTHNVVEINLSNCEISSSNLGALIAKNLVKIDFSNSQLNLEQIKSLLAALRTNESVKELNLQNTFNFVKNYNLSLGLNKLTQDFETAVVATSIFSFWCCKSKAESSD